MPERWQEELKKLRKVGPGDATWSRIEQGPSTDSGRGLPPPRQRVVAGVVAFAVFLAAGAFAWQILRPTTPSPLGETGGDVVVTFDVGDLNGVGPSATLKAGDQVVDGTIGSYCWTFPGGSGCADAVSPSFGANDFVPVERGMSLVIAGNANSVTGGLDHAGAFPFERVQGLGSITRPVVLDQPPGLYVLSLVAHADQGDVPFHFPIELVAQSPSDALVVDVSRDPAGAVLSFAGQSQRGIATEPWTPPADPYADHSLPDHTTDDFPSLISVPAGTTLRFTGDQWQSYTWASEPQDPTTHPTADFPATPGSYVYILRVGWPDREFDVAFGIEVTERATAPASTLHVSCTDPGAVVSAPVVEAGAKGVQVLVGNPSGAKLLEFHSDNADPNSWFSGRAQGGARYPWSIPPGDSSVVCLPDGSTDPTDVPAADFSVVDPNGYWADPVLDCPPGDHVNDVAAFVGVGAKGVDAAATVRGMLTGINPADSVRVPFYIDGGGAKDLRYVIVRDGRTVGIAHIDRVPGAPSDNIAAQVCSSSGITGGGSAP
jgi:hypothetical protein